MENSDDIALIKAWVTAAEKLGLHIETQVEFNTEEGKVVYPVLVKYFGGNKGTIIARHLLFMDYPMPKHKDYYFSAVNASTYSIFHEERFIDTLKDWGYFGPEDLKPKWYRD